MLDLNACKTDMYTGLGLVGGWIWCSLCVWPGLWFHSCCRWHFSGSILFGQYPLLAPSVCYPQMVWGCLRVCVLVYSTGIVRNEQMCAYFRFIPSIHTHTHTHILIPFEDSELTGLKVDIAVVCSKLSSFVFIIVGYGVPVIWASCLFQAKPAAKKVCKYLYLFYHIIIDCHTGSYKDMYLICNPATGRQDD